MTLENVNTIEVIKVTILSKFDIDQHFTLLR